MSQLWLLPLLALLFFCSGASALIYQVLWLRLLGLTFGVTTYAASTVWASFMAGLALGSLAAGRFADRVRRPLVWFGACELLIGVTALATPLGLDALQRAYVSVYPALPDSLSLMIVIRFAMAFAVLIVPTALMGATLPLVLKSSTFRTTRLGERIALLYGMNTAGAILGALAAGLYLIQAHGIRVTFLVAATLNLVVGLVALIAGRTIVAPDHSTVVDEPIDVPAESIRAQPHLIDGRRLYVILAVFAISGFTSLALEVVWFRVLTLFLRPTVYGFALMLAAVLAGIAVGSYLVTPFLDRRARWVAILAGLEMAIAVAAVVSFSALSRMSLVTTRVAPWLSQVMDEWLVYPAVSSLLAIFPTTLLMGMAFPIGLRLWASGSRARQGAFAERIGIFYSVNLAGAILGSIAAGFVLLPQIGSQSSLTVLGAITFVSGVLLLAVSELSVPVRVVAAVAASLVFGVAVVGAVDPFQEFVRQRYRGQRILWQEEGVEATAVVLATRGGDVSLTVNGNHQASTGSGMVFAHRSIGHLPMLVHPEARDALVIGLGGGATAGAVALHDGVEVDVVELAGSVVRGARHLGSGINYDLFSRPNVRLRVDDGRNYMLLTRRKYDVVTADVIHPIFAGSGNLYSAEYFQLVRKVLKPGGMALQWVSGTDAEYKTIGRTFLSVFPEATAWRDGTLLIGTVEPLHLKRSEFEWKLQVPGRKRAAEDLGTRTFEELLTAYRAGPDELRAFVGPGPILTDDQPLVEYFLSLPRDRDVDLSTLKGDVHRVLVKD
jgi:spermidine synthase